MTKFISNKKNINIWISNEHVHLIIDNKKFLLYHECHEREKYPLTYWFLLVSIDRKYIYRMDVREYFSQNDLKDFPVKMRGFDKKNNVPIDWVSVTKYLVEDNKIRLELIAKLCSERDILYFDFMTEIIKNQNSALFNQNLDDLPW